MSIYIKHSWEEDDKRYEYVDILPDPVMWMWRQEWTCPTLTNGDITYEVNWPQGDRPDVHRH